MKKQLLKAFSLLGLLAAFTFAPDAARAQTPVRLSVEVPFDFYVGDERLPAGRYDVGRLLRYTDDLLFVRGEGGRSFTSRRSDAVRLSVPSARHTLVFRRYEDQYFLTRAIMAGSAEARELVKSQRERSLESETATRRRQGRAELAAADAAKPQLVEIAALTR